MIIKWNTEEKRREEKRRKEKKRKNKKWNRVSIVQYDSIDNRFKVIQDEFLDELSMD